MTSPTNSSQIQPWPLPTSWYTDIDTDTDRSINMIANLCCSLFIHSWVWSHPLERGLTARSHTLKENWLHPFLKLSIINSPSVGVEVSKSFPAPCWNAGWIDLVRILYGPPELLWVCEHFQRQRLTPVLSDLLLLQFFTSLSWNFPWALGGGVWFRYPMCLRTPKIPSPALWPVSLTRLFRLTFSFLYLLPKELEFAWP